MNVLRGELTCGERPCLTLAGGAMSLTVVMPNEAGVSPIVSSRSAIPVCVARQSRKKSWPANSVASGLGGAFLGTATSLHVLLCCSNHLCYK
mgnify:CR=1 FL=1